jgi:Pyruvate/2-oxoacid:ferredoxin oxidoreductase delta subunit
MKNMVLRKIVKIDQQKCNGCGLCIPACAEGAIQIIDGKARLVRDIYCDGLGACLGKCPQDAITITQREAEEFDKKAAEEHVKRTQPEVYYESNTSTVCPSVKSVQFDKVYTASTKKSSPNTKGKNQSRLFNWPVQLKLIPSNAAFLKNADLLIAADCVPFTYADFHEDILKNKILVVGCPKLDDATLYRNKLAEMFKTANVKNVTVVNMEVPCCFGLYRLVKEAMEFSGRKIPVEQETISIKGKKI